jgi:hypothetical protein
VILRGRGGSGRNIQGKKLPPPNYGGGSFFFPSFTVFAAYCIREKKRKRMESGSFDSVSFEFPGDGLSRRKNELIKNINKYNNKNIKGGIL